VLCRKFPENNQVLLSYLLSPLEICCETKEMKESLTNCCEEGNCRKWGTKLQLLFKKQQSLFHKHVV
jgi:hypothetical protein